MVRDKVLFFCKDQPQSFDHATFNPYGIIYLFGCNVFQIDIGSEMHTFAIVHSIHGHTFNFAAPSRNEMNEWIQAILISIGNVESISTDLAYQPSNSSHVQKAVRNDIPNKSNSISSNTNHTSPSISPISSHRSLDVHHKSTLGSSISQSDACDAQSNSTSTAVDYGPVVAPPQIISMEDLQGSYAKVLNTKAELHKLSAQRDQARAKNAKLYAQKQKLTAEIHKLEQSIQVVATVHERILQEMSNWNSLNDALHNTTLNVLNQAIHLQRRLDHAMIKVAENSEHQGALDRRSDSFVAHMTGNSKYGRNTFRNTAMSEEAVIGAIVGGEAEVVQGDFDENSSSVLIYETVDARIQELSECDRKLRIMSNEFKSTHMQLMQTNNLHQYLDKLNQKFLDAKANAISIETASRFKAVATLLESSSNTNIEKPFIEQKQDAHHTGHFSTVHQSETVASSITSSSSASNHELRHDGLLVSDPIAISQSIATASESFSCVPTSKNDTSIASSPVLETNDCVSHEEHKNVSTSVSSEPSYVNILPFLDSLASVPANDSNADTSSQSNLASLGPSPSELFLMIKAHEEVCDILQQFLSKEVELRRNIISMSRSIVKLTEDKVNFFNMQMSST
jgi:hypothetical protein